MTSAQPVVHTGLPLASLAAPDRRGSWDWTAGARSIASVPAEPIRACSVSPDGERLAVVVPHERSSVIVRVNDSPWAGPFESVSSLAYLPDGSLVALGATDDGWRVLVDQRQWTRVCDQYWDLQGGGGVVAAAGERAGRELVVVDGQPWGCDFSACTALAVSPRGAVAAVVRGAREARDDTSWTVAVNGACWSRSFRNVYSPVFDPRSNRVAAGVRVGKTAYTIAVDGVPWEQTFQAVWEPLFDPTMDSLLAPVRDEQGWNLVSNGRPVWVRNYRQIWRLSVHPISGRIAAVVSSSAGRWTVAVDDRPWRTEFADAVRTPVFSPDGKRVAAAVRSGAWTVAVDDNAWARSFQMVSEPVFSPDGAHVAVMAEDACRRWLVVDGTLLDPPYERMWDPVFSPDGTSILLRVVNEGKYQRMVVPLRPAVR